MKKGKYLLNMSLHEDECEYGYDDILSDYADKFRSRMETIVQENEHSGENRVYYMFINTSDPVRLEMSDVYSARSYIGALFLYIEEMKLCENEEYHPNYEDIAEDAWDGLKPITNDIIYNSIKPKKLSIHDLFAEEVFLRDGSEHIITGDVSNSNDNDSKLKNNLRNWALQDSLSSEEYHYYVFYEREDYESDEIPETSCESTTMFMAKTPIHALYLLLEVYMSTVLDFSDRLFYSYISYNGILEQLHTDDPSREDLENYLNEMLNDNVKVSLLVANLHYLNSGTGVKSVKKE